jgi:hypothetical protein
MTNTRVRAANEKPRGFRCVERVGRLQELGLGDVVGQCEVVGEHNNVFEGLLEGVVRPLVCVQGGDGSDAAVLK